MSGTIRERHIGIVVDNNDDETRGRIKVASSSLMGVDDQGEALEYPVWLEPMFPHLLVGEDSDDGVVDSGFFFVPNVGVAVEFEITVSGTADKSFGQASIGSPDPRWVAALLLPGDSLNADFTTNYPHRMGWRSRKGSLILFDDSDGNERAVFRGPADANGKHGHVSIEPDGSMLIATNLSQLIHLTVDGGITMTDAHGNTISTAKDGVNLLTGKGSLITIGSDIKIVANGNVNVEGSKVFLGANAVESVIKGNTFQALFNAHTHMFVGNLGVPGVTVTPLIPLNGSELSLVVKTE